MHMPRSFSLTEVSHGGDDMHKAGPGVQRGYAAGGESLEGTEARQTFRGVDQSVGGPRARSAREAIYKERRVTVGSVPLNIAQGLRLRRN
jgi:hypothetical protein